VLAVRLLAAQGNPTAAEGWQIKPVFNAGFVMVHRISIGHLVKGYPANYELNLVRKTTGNKLWQRENNNPDIGITLQCLDFRNPAELGYGLTAAPFVEIPLNEKEKTARLIMRLSWGATYITKRFDIATNHKNVAIGSHVNAFVQFRWFWHIKLSERLRFEPGITFTHASNGRTKNPNLGLNVLSAGAGINYTLPKTITRSATVHDSSTRNKSANELLFLATTGLNQRGVLGPMQPCYLLSAAYQRNLRNTHKFSAGLDLFYDQNYLVDYENAFQKAATGIDKFRLSARLGYSYNVGRVSLPIELGYYIFQRTNPDAAIVSRLGVRYYSASGLVFAFGLRTHFAVAYNFEYGIGYRLYLR